MIRTSGLALVLAFAPVSLQAADAASISEALTQGDARLTFRYRYEAVNLDSMTRNARALTLKTRLNYQSLTYSGASFFIEFDDVTYVGDSDFNSTRNGNASYPKVVDPDGSDINQLYVTYQGDIVKAKLGRQRINYDNQRFIGGVA